MNELLEAIRNIAKTTTNGSFSQGIAQISKDTGLGRESLYKTFQIDSKPRFETIAKTINSFGLTLQARPQKSFSKKYKRLRQLYTSLHSPLKIHSHFPTTTI